MKQKILFIDRDGTLIDEPISTFQVDTLDKLKFKDFVISSLLKLMRFNYKFIIVTNQDGLGSKSFPKKNFNIPHFFMLDVFRSEGIIFEDVLICPHLSSDNCKCRKPKFQLLLPWLNEKNIDLKRSYVIGDRETDMELAKNIGLMGIQYHEKKCNWKKITREILKRNRYAEVIRETKETYVHVKVWLDLINFTSISTGINFFDHMLDQLSIHSGISMYILANGDLKIDDHHTVEDVGIVLGSALFKTLNNKNGIRRFGFVLPMDESEAKCSIDISNRPYLNFQANFQHKMVGDLNANMVEHFFYSLCYSMKITLHLSVLGKNDHHCVESLFKVFGQALRQAIKIEGNALPTSKGVL